ncbi:hypothetical protein ACET3Z_000710 [Daucus carota]
METLVISSLPYVLSLLIIPISLSLFLIFRKLNVGGSNLNVPPGSSGWPLLGESIKFPLAGPQEFIRERTKKYSPDVFQTSLLGEKMVVFCGAQGNKFLFTNESKLLTSWWPQSMKKALLFPEFVETSLKEVSALKRSFMHDILKPEALKQYIPVMDSMEQEHVDSEWAGSEVVKVFPMTKKFTFDLACRLFMSIVDTEHVTRLAKHFTLVTSGMFSVPIDLPGTAYNGAIKGGMLVRKELMKIITDRKKEMLENESEATTHDLLSQMQLVTDDKGECMSEWRFRTTLLVY